MSDLNDLDRRLVWIGRSAVLTGGIALAGGLLVYLVSPGSARANTLLQTGLLLLMATPALRLVTVVFERSHRRDIQFADSSCRGAARAVGDALGPAAMIEI